MAFSGSITPLGDMKLVKTSEDGIVAGINFTVTGAKGFSKPSQQMQTAKSIFLI